MCGRNQTVCSDAAGDPEPRRAANSCAVLTCCMRLSGALPRPTTRRDHSLEHSAENRKLKRERPAGSTRVARFPTVYTSPRPQRRDNARSCDRKAASYGYLVIRPVGMAIFTRLALLEHGIDQCRLPAHAKDRCDPSVGMKCREHAFACLKETTVSSGCIPQGAGKRPRRAGPHP